MRIVVAITGASGIQYGVATLYHLSDTSIETHLVISQSARRVLDIETDYEMEEVCSYADEYHHPSDIAAPVASGSFQFDSMIVCPCSMKTLGYIANGIAEGLIPRIADVCLKEGHDLLLVPRESPMAHTHLDNLVKASEAGATIAPAAPGFYTHPQTLNEFVNSFALRLLDCLGIELSGLKRWPESSNEEED